MGIFRYAIEIFDTWIKFMIYVCMLHTDLMKATKATDFKNHKFNKRLYLSIMYL